MAYDLRRDGFAIFDGLFSEQEMSELLFHLDEVRHRRTRAGIRHLMSDPYVASVASDPRLHPILRQAETGYPFRATLFDKSARSNWLVTWHQDTALPVQEKRETLGWGPWSVKDGVHYGHAPTHVLQTIVALRIHIDPSTSDNGPLRVIPGSHKLGVLTDYEVASIAEQSDPVECLCGVGGVVAMRPLLIHASSKTRNNLPRRVLHLEYALAPRLGHDLVLATA